MARRSLSTEKGYEKNAWMLIALVGVVGLIFGLVTIFEIVYDPTYFSNRLGQSVNSFSASYPKAWSAIQGWERDEGTEVFGFALLTSAIAFTAYRKGERWSWYILWYVPAYLTYDTLNTFGSTYLPYLFAFLLAGSIAGLILPYRKFFPIIPRTNSHST